MPFAPSDLYTGGYTGDIFDASDTTRLWKETAETNNVSADADTVKSWRGQFANYKLFDAIGTLPGTYKTSIINGLSVVRCATTRLQTTFASNEIIVDLAQPLSTLMVTAQTTVADQMIWRVDGADMQRYRSNGGTQEIRYYSDAHTFDTTTGGGAGDFNIIGMELTAVSGTPGTCTTYPKGGPGATSGSITRATTTGFDNICVGSNYGSEYLVGDIAYLMFINRLLTDAEWDQLGGWASSRFGLTWTNLIASTGNPWYYFANQ